MLIVVNIIIKIKKSKRLYKAKKIEFKLDNIVIKVCLDKFKQHRKLKKIIDRYVNRLCLFNSKLKLENEYIITAYLILTLLISFAVSIISFKLFAMWYAPISNALVVVFISYYVGTFYINKNLKKIYGQFPIALQSFTDEYVLSKNIKNALNESYSKMPKEISKLFENLSRKLDSKNYNDVLKSFADGLDLIWCYAFVEILTLSYEGADDISEELIYLNELTGDEMKEDEETLTSISESNSIFVVLNILTFAMFIFNLIVDATSKELYFMTYTGNTILLFWIISFILGVSSFNLLKKL